MLPYIVIGGLILAVALLYRSLFRSYAKMPAGEPHDCAAGSFLPQMRTSTRYLGQRGGKEFGIVVFEGLFCSACGKEIFCPCIGPRQKGSILGGEDERYSILECCDHPHYRLVPEQDTEREPSNVIPFPGARNDDHSN
jgi:hypothetical protein